MSVELKEGEKLILEIKDLGELEVEVIEVDRNVLDVGDSLKVEHAGGSEEDIGLDLELEVTEVHEEHVLTEVKDVKGTNIFDEEHNVKISY